MAAQNAPALKEIFDYRRLVSIADAAATVYAGFDRSRFIAQAASGLDQLSLMARLRRVSECLHQQFPTEYPLALEPLNAMAPLLDHRFVTLILPEYVARYGQAHFDLSMAALQYLTRFGSAEFAVRPFLQLDQGRALIWLQRFAHDENEHVRRLASEGSRPRLPWALRLNTLIQDPSVVAPILNALRNDPSLYVRKSVANHLNDISKDHPHWVMDLLDTWPLAHPFPGWIARHGLRSLIKAGDRRALHLIGAGDKAEVQLETLTLTPATIAPGQSLEIAFRLTGTAKRAQRLVIDYAIHYIKRNGSTARKVFKLKNLTLAPGTSVTIRRRQPFRDFTTRSHYAGQHQLDILINGECLASSAFCLQSGAWPAAAAASLR